MHSKVDAKPCGRDLQLKAMSSVVCGTPPALKTGVSFFAVGIVLSLEVLGQIEQTEDNKPGSLDVHASNVDQSKICQGVRTFVAKCEQEAAREAARSLGNITTEQLILWTTTIPLSTLTVKLPAPCAPPLRYEPLLATFFYDSVQFLASSQEPHSQRHFDSACHKSIPVLFPFGGRPNTVLNHHCNNTHRIGPDILDVAKTMKLLVLNMVSF